MDRRVTPAKGVTSPTWGPLPPCKQALCLQTLFLLFKFGTSETIEPFASRTSGFLVNTLISMTLQCRERRGAASLPHRNRAEIRNPMRYDIGAGTKAMIRYCVNIVLHNCR